MGYFKMRKQKAKAKGELAGASGQVNQSLDLHDEQQLNNSRIPLHSSSGHPSHPQPDIIETERGDRSRFNNDNNFEAMEHYDLENASSIAPSDIDIIYHYKGYREGGRHGRELNMDRWGQGNEKMTSSPIRLTSLGNNKMQSTPLARLSPSSEMSHQTPRILTLQDISGKPIQSALLQTQQGRHSQRSQRMTPLSPLSDSSGSDLNSSSRARRRKKKKPTTGLTTEEMERVNNLGRNSSLVSTLDGVSMDSTGVRKKNKF